MEKILTFVNQGDTIPSMESKRILIQKFFTAFLLSLIALLLAACEGIPDWIFDPQKASLELTAEANPEYMDIAITGTPIDAVAYASPTPPSELQTPDPITPSPVVITLPPPVQKTDGEYCMDPVTGNSLSYEEALAIASDSACTAEGDLQPAHFCNENTGTWWIGLNSEKEGCNPACVIDVNGALAEINWRCTGVSAADTPVATLEKFAEWRGTIHRQPQGSQVEYRFLHDDGRWFDIDAREYDLRQQFAVAAWSASNVMLSGEKTAVPDTLLIEDLTQFLTQTAEARDLSPFAMASSSSQLAADEGGIYHAWGIVDGQVSKPWCEGADGEGLGEWIQLEFSSPVEIKSLRLSNGYQGASYLYDINGRVKTLILSVDGEFVHNWHLYDSVEQQSINLAGDVVPGMMASTLRLEIEETFPGWEFEDTCIAELEVWGRPAE